MCYTNHKNNFFLWKDKDKNAVCASTNHNKQFFSMKGQGQKYGQTKEVYRLTKINIWMASNNFAAALADGCELAFNNRNAYHLYLFNSVLFQMGASTLSCMQPIE